MLFLESLIWKEFCYSKNSTLIQHAQLPVNKQKIVFSAFRMNLLFKMRSLHFIKFLHQIASTEGMDEKGHIIMSKTLVMSTHNP